MAERPVPDPMAVWRDMMSQWEKGFNALANQTMASDEFSGSMNQGMAVMLRMQQTMAETMASSLTKMNLPSREDIARIGERLQNVESLMNRMLALVEGQAGQTEAVPGAAGPPRTKRPPSKADEPA